MPLVDGKTDTPSLSGNRASLPSCECVVTVAEAAGVSDGASVSSVGTVWVGEDAVLLTAAARRTIENALGGAILATVTLNVVGSNIAVYVKVEWRQVKGQERRVKAGQKGQRVQGRGVNSET